MNLSADIETFFKGEKINLKSISYSHQDIYCPGTFCGEISFSYANVDFAEARVKNFPKEWLEFREKSKYVFERHHD